MPPADRIRHPLTRLTVKLRPFILAVLLLMLPVRRSMAEDRADFTLGYYLEDHHRVEVYSPSLLLETDVNPSTVMRLQSTYDVVSGASPTGAPLTRLTRAEQRQVASTQNGIGIIGYHVTAGPTPHTPGPTVPIYGPVSSATKILQTVQVPFGKPFLPMQTFTDQRLGLDLELEHHSDDWIWSLTTMPATGSTQAAWPMATRETMSRWRGQRKFRASSTRRPPCSAWELRWAMTGCSIRSCTSMLARTRWTAF